MTAFLAWRQVPPPRRGELVRLFGEVLREEKDELGRLVSRECGKILSEGLGEVQEMIDICDFAVGLSRQLYGLTIATERPGHRMMETWHPLGVVGVISAFNFPGRRMGVERLPRLRLRRQRGLEAVGKDAALRREGGRSVRARRRAVRRRRRQGCWRSCRAAARRARRWPTIPRVPLVSATGSTRMGRELGPRVAARFGRSLLELGGNNAMIVAPSADLGLAERAIAFAAMGTAGQRCTTLRRLIVHESIYDRLVPRLKSIWSSAKVGDPLDPDTLVGPLIDAQAVEAMQAALAEAKGQGGAVHGGEPLQGCYVRPALVEMPGQGAVMVRETFAPILYVLRYSDLTQAVAIQNGVPQGLASSIFTTDLREAETFLSAAGSDCGIANVNIGPSGAEIGGAFGGEKETGGGRESGSDAWRAYMRRATNTINYSLELPLAQGVDFSISEQ